MSIQSLKESLPDFAKDIRLNVSTVLTVEGAPGLSKTQLGLISLSCAYATKNNAVISHLSDEFSSVLSDAEVTAAKSAATIMAMNNIYYKFVHLAEDPEFKNLRANLRMTVIGRPGVDKIDFEMMCLAVSIINGCGMCIAAHKDNLIKEEVTRETIQSIVRVTSVIQASAQAISIKDL